MRKTGRILSVIVDKGYQYVVGAFFTAVTLWLFTVNIFSTSYMSADGREHTYYCGDRVWLNLLLLFLFCGATLWAFGTGRVRRLVKELERDKVYVRIRRILLFILFAEGILLVFAAQVIPGADQKYVLEAAYSLRVKDYSPFLEGGYIARYPNQLGLTLAVYALSMVFGDRNYLAFQVLNVFCLVMIYKSLGDIAGYFGMGKLSRLVLCFLGILFLPPVLYVTFVYGTMPGLALSLTAIAAQMRFLEKYRVRDMLLASGLIAAAVMLKSNYLIFFIGMFIYALARMVRDKKAAAAGLVFAMTVMYLLLWLGARTFIEQRTGEPLGKGTSSWSWIAMGLQENTKRADGWYNAYNSYTYTESGYDTKIQAKLAKKEIGSRLEYFMENKEEAVRFFVEKCASQWNNPSFQGFWLIQTRASGNERPGWLRRLLSIDGSHILYRLLDFLQMLILFGAVLYLILCKKRAAHGFLLCESIVAGGFLFHLFWEAKCQYTLPYFILFLPISIRGYGELAGRYGTLILSEKGKATEQRPGAERFGKRRRDYPMLAAGICLWAFLFSVIRPLNAVVNTDRDTKEYEEYVEAHQYDRVEDGNYFICPLLLPGWALASENTGAGNAEKVYMAKKGSENSLVKLTTFYGKAHICFAVNSLYLDLYGNSEGINAWVDAYDGNGTAAQEWGFKETEEEGVYYILIGRSSALTYDEGGKSVTVQEFTYGENQKWRLEQEKTE